MIGMLVWLMVSNPIPELQRTTYDIQLIEGTQIVQAKLALNYLDENRFSLHLSKSPTGTLFTYWATPETNFLSFPKQKVAFSGTPEVGFALFADGPKLNRAQWLSLLQNGEYEDLGAWQLHRVDGWLSLHDHPITFRIRWKERATKVKKQVNRRVLEPDLTKFDNIKPLQALLGYAWSNK